MAIPDNRIPPISQRPYAGGKLTGWPSGMDNRAPDTMIPATSVRDAVNVDFLAAGQPRRRVGMAQRIADAGAHSVFSDNDSRLVYATPTTLKVATPNMAATTILTDARLAKPLSYVEVNGKIYFSNEDINGCITAQNTYEPWGIAPPPNTFSVTTTPGTRYVQVTCTYVTDTGEESGAPVGIITSCVDNPYITVSNLPQPSDSRVTYIRVYISDVDGEECYRAGDVPIGTPVFTYNGYVRGEILRTDFLIPPPPGQLLTYNNGVIYIATGNMVVQTEPLNYGLYDPGRSFLMYPERVTLCAGVSGPGTNGIYVAADILYFLPNAGSEEQISQVQTLPYRVVEGAWCSLPDSQDIMFFTNRGLVRATTDGKVMNISENQLAVANYERGSMAVVSYNGHQAVMVFLRGRIKPNPLVAKDYLATIPLPV